MGRFDKVLLASDFDNTLVNTRAALEAGTDLPPLCGRDRKALAYFTENGGLFAVSTGRAVAAFAAYAKDLPINVPCVIANGAGLYDFRENRYLYTAFLGDEVRGHVADLLSAFPTLAFEIYHDDRRIHAMHPNAYIWNHEHLTRAKVQVVESFDEVDLPIIKLLFEEDEELLLRVRGHILSRPWSKSYELIFSGPHLLEMTAAGASKGNMVLMLAERLGVARGDVYCIGDHNNDVPMIRVSAVPFAPGNAIAEVKAIPGVRVLSDVKDGAVADAIEILDHIYAQKTTVP